MSPFIVIIGGLTSAAFATAIVGFFHTSVFKPLDDGHYAPLVLFNFFIFVVASCALYVRYVL